MNRWHVLYQHIPPPVMLHRDAVWHHSHLQCSTRRYQWILSQTYSVIKYNNNHTSRPSSITCLVSSREWHKFMDRTALNWPHLELLLRYYGVWRAMIGCDSAAAQGQVFQSHSVRLIASIFLAASITSASKFVFTSLCDSLSEPTHSHMILGIV